ncbi:MAG: patatin-like phospholipase family protein [Hyphomicrobiales bacterium]|nr:patatin-like phospholipase family protein [Hyphomicrobiales bacterium]
MTKIGLALGGGGARGIAHIHVLEAFDDLGIKPSVISGSSIGGIVGAGYAAGMSGAEVREYAIKTFTKSSKILSKFWNTPRPAVGKLFDKIPNRFAEIDPLRIMNSFLPSGLPREFSQLTIPMKIIVADFYDMTELVLSEGDLFQALAGTAAIPVLFRPQIINERLVVDGGILNPVPFDVFGDDMDLVVAVDVVGRPVGNNPNLPSRRELGYGTLQLLMQRITSLKIEQKKPDLMIRPDIHGYRVLDFLKTEEILWNTFETRQDTRQRLEKLLKTL